MKELPGTPDCCWSDALEDLGTAPLAGSVECDVMVVGAGIVGLTAALALCDSKRSVVVLEGRRVGRQVTGRSTGKVTTQHGLVYRHLIDTFGRETAQAYADANREALEQVREWIASFGIDCEHERKPAYAYATQPGSRDALEREAEAARSLGLEARTVGHAPLPFATSGALEFPDQSQFNPARYLVGLAHAVQARGGRIHEHSRARDFDQADDGRWQVSTGEGSVTARQLVVATHITVKSPVGYANRTQPRSHAGIAFRIGDPAAFEGMYIAIDAPTHSIRTGRDREGPLLLVLGPRFDTGQEGDVAGRFRELERWVREHLPVGEAAWRWCNEDYDTADRMPYVGQPDPARAPGFHVATGFNAWGLTNGTAAGLLIASDIATGTHRRGSLYDPARPVPEGFHRSGDTQSRVDDAAGIAPGDGGILVRGEEKLAVWRDDAGQLHAVSAKCTHKGCTVTWNNADRTWDCPCHGSIFEAGGQVIHGPAREPLPPRTL